MAKNLSKIAKAKTLSFGGFTSPTVPAGNYKVVIMKFSFPPAPHSGKVSLSIKEASKSYDDLDVLESISLEIVKGEKNYSARI